MQFPLALERLVYELSRLPGVGRKTAQRLAFSILRNSYDETKNLANALLSVKEQIKYCSVCSGLILRNMSFAPKPRIIKSTSNSDKVSSETSKVWATQTS